MKWDLYERNLLSECHVRYGGYGGIGYYHVSDTYVALGVQGEGNFVNGQDFGVQEQFTTIKSSIEARVGNVPEDDEALAQKHLGNNLHGNKDKDKDNTDNNKP